MGISTAKLKNDDFFNTLYYYEIVFLESNKRVEVERSNAFEIIHLLNENNILNDNSLNNMSIERFVAKYGTNSISSMVNNTQYIIGQQSNYKA